MNNHRKYDFLFKVLLLGEAAVGKTCILMRYIRNEFSKEQIMTLGVDFMKKNLMIQNEKVVLQLWDTAGQDRFSAVTKQLFKGAQAVVLVYSITDQVTFDKVKYWMNQIEQQVGKSITKVLVGNKCDMEDQRKVKLDDAKKIAEENNFGFFESSAKNNINIEPIFNYLVEELYSKIKKDEEDPKNKAIRGEKLNQSTIRAKKKCCI